MNTKQTEALKLALEALEKMGRVMKQSPDTEKAIAAIREALAEQPAPVAEPWGEYIKEGETPFERFMRERKDLDALMTLYQRAVAENEQLKAQQEPVAEVKLKERGGNAGIATVIHEIFDPMREPLRVGDKLYTSPPASKPLTDEQLREALRQCPRDTVENLRVRWLYAKDFARAIEAAHGIMSVPDGKGDA